jgi:hypothetical protein
MAQQTKIVPSTSYVNYLGNYVIGANNLEYIV